MDGGQVNLERGYYGWGDEAHSSQVAMYRDIEEKAKHWTSRVLSEIRRTS